MSSEAFSHYQGQLCVAWDRCGNITCPYCTDRHPSQTYVGGTSIIKLQTRTSEAIKVLQHNGVPIPLQPPMPLERMLQHSAVTTALLRLAQLHDCMGANNLEPPPDFFKSLEPVTLIDLPHNVLASILRKVIYARWPHARDAAFSPVNCSTSQQMELTEQVLSPFIGIRRLLNVAISELKGVIILKLEFNEILEKAQLSEHQLFDVSPEQAVTNFAATIDQWLRNSACHVRLRITLGCRANENVIWRERHQERYSNALELLRHLPHIFPSATRLQVELLVLPFHAPHEYRDKNMRDPLNLRKAWVDMDDIEEEIKCELVHLVKLLQKVRVKEVDVAITVRDHQGRPALERGTKMGQLVDGMVHDAIGVHAKQVVEILLAQANGMQEWCTLIKA